MGTTEALFFGGNRAGILAAATVIGIATGAGVAHLQEFARQVGTHKVALVQIGQKFFENQFTAVLGQLRGGKAPVRQQFGFVGPHQQYALLTPAHPVQRWLGAKVNPGKVQRVFEAA